MGSPLFDVISLIPTNEALLGTLVPRLDAALLVTECARHGLSAYVADALHRAKVELSTAAAKQLAHDAQLTVAQGNKNKRLLLKVLEALAAHGMTPVVLKGYGLARRLYDSPLVRPATDVDVLVRREELPTVHGALQRLGLNHQKDEALNDVFEEHHHEAFEGHAGLVEAHFRLFAGFGMRSYDDEGVQARSWRSTLDGRQVRYLAAEDEFLYLAVHAANHAFLRASWLVDLQRIALQVPPDWQVVAERARQVGFTVPYAAALDVLMSTLQVPLPDEARRSAGHRYARAFVHRHLFTPSNMASARFSQGGLAPVALRLWLTETPGRVATELLTGARRFARRTARALRP